MDQSAFKLYSFGIAAENLGLETDVLQVTPLEILPLINGQLNTESEELTYEGVDEEGKTDKITIQLTTNIPCKWLHFGSNRVTPPNVRRGERILIYRYADSVDAFYWVSTNLDEHLRRLETAVWLFSADPDGLSDTPRSAENSYSISVSTHTKQITIQTVKLNNEPFAYTIQLNTDVGALVAQDDVGNYIQMDSAETKITLMNAEKTEFSLDKQNLYLYAENEYRAIVKKAYVIECLTYSLTATDSVDITTKVATIKASDSFKVETEAATFTTPLATFSKDVTVTGNVDAAEISAGKGSIGGCNFADGVMQCKTLVAQEDISAPNV